MPRRRQQATEAGIKKTTDCSRKEYSSIMSEKIISPQPQKNHPAAVVQMKATAIGDDCFLLAFSSLNYF